MHVSHCSLLEEPITLPSGTKPGALARAAVTAVTGIE